MAKKYVLLPDAVARFPHCTTPDVYQNDEVYKVDLIFSAEDARRIFDEEWMATAREEWPDVKAEELYRGQFRVLRHRVIERNDDGSPRRGPDDKVIPVVDKFGRAVFEDDDKGRVFFTAKSRFKPKLYNACGKEDPNVVIENGDIVSAQVTFTTHVGGPVTDGKPTVAIKLVGVQSIRQANHGDGGSKAWLLEGRDRSADAAVRVAPDQAPDQAPDRAPAARGPVDLSAAHAVDMGYQHDDGSDDQPPF